MTHIINRIKFTISRLRAILPQIMRVGCALAVIVLNAFSPLEILAYDFAPKHEDNPYEWGVLAMNPNKSEYALGEAANVSFAVLDNKGEMVCDADLNLTVTHKESGISREFSTSNGTITVNEECSVKAKVYKPDFETTFKLDEYGTYELTLAAETDAGAKTIQETVSVPSRPVPFVIERIGATRLYPVETYDMEIRIRANEDFDGHIEEPVPASFEIIGAPLVQSKSELQAGTTVRKVAVMHGGSEQKISFDLSLKAGDEMMLSYEYDAPDVSPEFYNLGPLGFYDAYGEIVYQEPRAWQLANDADTGFLTHGTAAAVASGAGDNNGFANPGNVTANDGTVAADNNSGSTATTDGCGTFPQAEDDQHDFYNFNFSIPAGSTINGIEVIANAWVAQPTTGDDQLCFGLSWNGGSNWTTATGTGELVTSDGTNYTKGGPTLNWGRTWTDSEFSNANFRLRVMPDSTGGVTADYSLDYLAVKVYYTLPPRDVSGNVYSDEGSTGLTNSRTIKLVVNGGTTYSTTTMAGTGEYDFLDLNLNGGDEVLTIFLDGAAEDAVTVTKATTTDMTGVNLYQNRVIVRSETTSTITNANLGLYDSDEDPDIQFDSDSNNLVVADGAKLIVWTGDTFTPGGTVETSTASAANPPDGDLTVQSGATISMGTNALSVGGDLTITGTFSKSTGQTTTFTGTDSSLTITPGTGNFENLVFSGGGGWTFGAAAVLDGDLTMTSGTISGASNFTVSGGEVIGNGTINFTDGTFLVDGTGGFGGNSNWTFNHLTFGDGSGVATTTSVGSGTITSAATTTVAASQILDAGTRTWILTGSGEPLSVSGTFTASSSEVSYRGTVGTTIPTSLEYYDLDFSPSSGTPTYSISAPISAATSAPTFIQEAETIWSSTASPKTTASFDVEAGDILVAYSITGNGEASVAISGGSLSWGDPIQSVAVTAYTYVSIWSATVDTDKSMTVSFTCATCAGSGSMIGGNVLTFRGSEGIGGSNKTNVASGAPTLDITTTQASSSIVVANGDWVPVDGASRTWRANAGAFTEQSYYYNGSSYTIYGGYHADAGAAGTYAVGLSAPSGQKYAIVAVEVKGTITEAGTPLTVTNDLTIGGTGNATVDVNTSDHALDIGGSLIIGSGDTFLASNSAALTVGNDITIDGTFTHNSGTVVLDTATTATISSAESTTFNNLTVTTPGKTLQFEKHSANVPVFTIAGTMLVTGANGNNITISSDTLGSQWLVHFNSAQASITYALIKDSGCAAGSASLTPGATVQSGGNNGACWGLGTDGGIDYGGDDPIEGGSGGGIARDGGAQSSVGEPVEGGSGGGQSQTGGGQGGGGGASP